MSEHANDYEPDFLRELSEDIRSGNYPIDLSDYLDACASAWEKDLLDKSLYRSDRDAEQQIRLRAEAKNTAVKELVNVIRVAQAYLDDEGIESSNRQRNEWRNRARQAVADATD